MNSFYSSLAFIILEYDGFSVFFSSSSFDKPEILCLINQLDIKVYHKLNELSKQLSILVTKSTNLVKEFW